MSETYTTGGDTWANFSHHIREGQTFTPTIDHTLLYIDLYLHQFPIPTTLEVEIRICDASHIPGDYVWSHSTKHFPFTYTYQRHPIVRFKMTPYLLKAGKEYAIIVYEHLPAVYGAIPWLYDKGDATYPRGLRIIKPGQLFDWQTRAMDDHIFTEFGDPPAPLIDPIPPIQNFLPTLFTTQATPTTVTISLATNVPCHLWLYWTDVTPVTHRITRIRRGLATPWFTRFCFVSWHAVEQNEPGDTLYHTFDLPGWLSCQTRWFTFRGNIDKELSPSVGPIFKYHNIGPYRYQHYITGEDGGFGTRGPWWPAQTFTPQYTHTITKVRLMLHRAGSPGLLTASIRATDATFKPTGPDLTTGTLDGNTVALPPARNWYEIPLDTPYILTAGTTYAIVLRAPDGDDSNYIVWWWDSTAPTYPDGFQCYSNDSGISWNTIPTTDHLFEEWGLPP